MKKLDLFANYAESPLPIVSKFKPLDGNGIAHWAKLSRWNLLSAIYLSMGIDPDATKRLAGRLSKNSFPTTESELKQIAEFSDRVKRVYGACNQDLYYDVVSSEFAGGVGAYVDREVDTSVFIAWARKNFTSNCEQLFDLALESYSNATNKSVGKLGAEPKRKLLDRIKQFAHAELDAGCRCHNIELAIFLRGMKRGEEYIIREERQSKAGKQPTHKIFVEAVREVFTERDLKTRFEIKPLGQERGKKYCDRHRDLT